jgi:ADP-heptose:LPS heptosyltransferase
VPGERGAGAPDRAAAEPPVREVLVVELLGGLGDLLLALPAVHALARSHPQAAVRVLTFAPGSQLLAADPAVAEVVETRDHADGAPRRAVEAQLRRTPPDLAVSTTSYDGIGAVVAAGSRRAVTNLWRRPPADELVDERFLRLLAADGVVDARYTGLAPEVVLTAQERAAGEALLGTASVPVLLLPEAGMPVKQWPLARWRGLAASLARDGHDVLVPTGGDAALAEAVVAGVAGARRLPRVSLRGLGAVAAAAAGRGGAGVAADTGPARLASACGLPVVGLYGPTVAGRYGLRPGRNVNLQGLPECGVRRPGDFTGQECWWSARCPLTGEDPACMADLGLDAVLAAVRGRLARVAA